MLGRQRVGFVFQELNLVPELTVGENITLPLRLDHRHVTRTAIEQAAARVGLQPAAIARALIISPEVIFADEPTGALDPYTAEGVMRLLRQAAGTTVVVVTHQPKVTRFCDRTVFLYADRVDAITTAPEPTAAARARRASQRPARERRQLMRGWMLAGLRRKPGTTLSHAPLEAIPGSPNTDKPAGAKAPPTQAITGTHLVTLERR